MLEIKKETENIEKKEKMVLFLQIFGVSTPAIPEIFQLLRGLVKLE